MVHRIVKAQLVSLLLSISFLASARAATFVTLGFDDNTADQKIALSLLNARDLKATLYINTAFVGTSGFYMNQTDLHAAAAAGHEIAGHSLSHRNLTTLSAADLVRDVCDDRARLVEWGFSPISFAYPYAAYNAAVQNAVRDCGYLNARSVGGLQCAGCVAAEPVPPQDAYGIRSLPLVVRETTLSQLQQRVIAAENAGGGWLSFIFHRVCDACGTDSITQADLTAFLDWLKAREPQGTLVRTTAQVTAQVEEVLNPTVSGLSPQSWPAGGSAFNLTVDGRNFSAGAAVRFNGAMRTGVLQGTTRLIVYIPPGDVAAAGTASVSVVNPGPGGASNALSFSITGGTGGTGGAVASLSADALSPAQWPAGGSAFNLTVDGTGFVAGAVVRFNGVNRPGVLQGTTRLIVYIPPGDVLAPGTAEVVVVNPNGVVSNALSLLATGTGPPVDPSPEEEEPSDPPVGVTPSPSGSVTLTALHPVSWPAGGTAFNLTADGTGFTAGSAVRFNGVNRTGVLQGTTRLIVYIPPSDVAVPKTASVDVVVPGADGGVSNALSFPVTGGGIVNDPIVNEPIDDDPILDDGGSALNPVPTISALSPLSWPAGGSAFNLTVDGRDFVDGAVVRYNNANRPGVRQGTTRLIVYIPPSDVIAPSTAAIRVFNPEPGGGTSNALTFTVSPQGSAPAGLTPAVADPAFFFQQVYAFPNPSRRGHPVTLRLQTGIADAVHLRIFDVSGAPVHHGTAGAPILVDDGNGLGSQYTYDYVWNAAEAGSGIYVYRLEAKKSGEPEIRKVGKIGVLK